MTSELRVGIVDFLNSRPLAWDFLQGGVPPGFAASYHPPADVADLLRAGDLDIGLIPSIEVQRIPDLVVLEGPCVAAQQEVRSVLLVSRVPPERIRRLALDRNSRTSAALVRIVLAERFGVAPEFLSVRPRLDEMLDVADGALLIGDPALQVDHDSMQVLDLAREWRVLTGLPFVFALWAVRRESARPGLGDVFRSSRDHGVDSLQAIAAESSARLGLVLSDVLDYLGRNLCFELGAAEKRSLVEFFMRSAAMGMLDEVRPLHFVD